MSVKRTVSLVTAICFILTGLFTVPASASEESAQLQADDLNKPAISTNSSIQIDQPEENFGTTGTAINITRSAINITRSVINASGTAITITGTDIISIRGATISTSGTAVNILGAAAGTSGTKVNTTGTAINTTGSSLTSRAGEAARDDESLWYISQIPMKKEHQKLLWDYCKQRGLEYIDMLALISLESNFYEKCSSGKYKGYFQISTIHHKGLAAQLKTANKPLDGAININWGTAMYSWILADKRLVGLKDKQLRDAALSIYQQGTGGYDRHGLSTKYLKVYYKKREIILSYYGARVEEKDRSE